MAKYNPHPIYEPWHPVYPKKYPDDFVIVQDTREQHGLFTPGCGVPYIDEAIPLKCLPHPDYLARQWSSFEGAITDRLLWSDYSLKGYEREIIIERKNVSDLYGSLGNGRDKFIEKLMRMSTYEWNGLLIEGNELETLTRQFHSDMYPSQIFGALISFPIRYGTHVYYAHTVERGRLWVVWMLLKWFKVKRGIR